MCGYEIFSPIKINLSLRITSVRKNGLHNLVSLLLKLPQIERLTINELTANNSRDNIIVRNFNFDGDNILSKVLELCRGAGWEIPPLEISIYKKIPPGTGLGGGSGNAAEFFAWLENMYGTISLPEIPGLIGADVPFLCGSNSLALATGIGNELAPLRMRPGFVFAVFMPEWASATVDAYKKIDGWYRTEGFPLTETAAKNEAETVVDCLNSGKRWGLLPNDFTPVLLHERPQYSLLFDILSCTKATAWGITGSGSAAFAVFNSADISDVRHFKSLFISLKWLRKIFFWSGDL